MNLRKTTIKGEQYLISAKENKDDYFGVAYSLLKKMFVEMTQLAKAYLQQNLTLLITHLRTESDN